MLVQTGHRVAAALSVIFLIAAAIATTRYWQAHGGWDIASGSNDLMTIMLLVLGFVLTLSFALLRPGKRNPTAARWTASRLVVGSSCRPRVLVECHRRRRPLGRNRRHAH